MAEKQEDPYVDGGYAWIILAGCFVMYLLTVGTIKAYGILYTELVPLFQAGSSNTAWIGGICMIFMFALGPFANLLCTRFTFRKVSFIGGILLGAGHILSAFVPRMEYLYLTLGVVGGLGYGLTFSPCSTIISFYFSKHRALANGIVVSSSGLAALVLPFLYKFLIETFNVRGALLIIGGILLNVCVSSCVFRQPTSLSKKEKLLKIDIKQKNEEHKAFLNGNSNRNEDIEKKDSKFAGFDVFKCSLFKNALLILYTVAFMLSAVGYGSNVILIPAHVRFLGYDRIYEVISVSIMGCAEVIARILFGYLVDLKIVKQQYVFIFCMVIGAGFCFMVPHFDSFIFIGIYAAIIGIFPGSFWSLISVMVIDVVGMKDFTSAFGLILICISAGFGVGQPAIGWIRDYTGCWRAAFVVDGCILLLAGLIVMLEIVLGRWCVEPKAVEDEADVESLQMQDRIQSIPSVANDFEILVSDNQADVSFTSERISKIYLAFEPESPPRSPQRTYAPIVDSREI